MKAYVILRWVRNDDGTLYSLDLNSATTTSEVQARRYYQRATRSDIYESVDLVETSPGKATIIETWTREATQ